MFAVNAILHALQISLFMLWEVFWPLALGFLLSAVVQTVVSKGAVTRALGRPDLKGFVLACGLGAASSSCSYAAVAVARALFRRGANFVNAFIAAMLAESGLSILGLGPQQDMTLGMMIYWALNYGALLQNLWWWWATPVMTLIVVFLALYLVHVGLDEVSNPRLRGQ